MSVLTRIGATKLDPARRRRQSAADVSSAELRDVIHVPAAARQAELETAALSAEKVKPFVDGKVIKKIIVVPKKLVNIVVG